MVVDSEFPSADLMAGMRAEKMVAVTVLQSVVLTVVQMVRR
jgi:hypothetical protein